MELRDRYGDLVCLFGGWLQYADVYGSSEAALRRWAMTVPRQVVQRSVADLKEFLRQTDRDLAPIFNYLGTSVIGFEDDAQVRLACKWMIREMKAALAIRDLPRIDKRKGKGLAEQFQAKRRPGDHSSR